MSDGASHAGTVLPCCYQRAATPGAMFCGECRSPILRCMAYAECGGLVGEDGRCSVCVAPELYLDAGARRDVKAGGALVLPLIFRNDSPVRRPLFVTGVWVREGVGSLRKQDVAWARLEAGASNPLWVQTGALERQGRQLFEVSFAVATRYRWREETFAFRSNLELDIEQGGSVVINQTINAGGQGNGLGGAVNAPIRIEAATDGGDHQDRRTEASLLGLTRADVFEKSSGVRGYTSGPLQGAAVRRNAAIAWKGFAKTEAPITRPITTDDALICAGRSALKDSGGDADVRLLVRNDKGEINEELSRAISRRHIHFFLQNGRLYVHAAGESGLIIGDRHVQRDGIEPVDQDDIIHVLPKHADALALQVRMRANFGEIQDITITRVPAVPEGAR
jgi:hypothetical protein